jgi:hypothetical protein
MRSPGQPGAPRPLAAKPHSQGEFRRRPDRWCSVKACLRNYYTVLNLPLEERQRIARLERIRTVFVKAVYCGPNRKRRTIQSANTQGSES